MGAPRRGRRQRQRRNTHSTPLGLNGGAGVELRLSVPLKLGLEAKYTLIQHYPNASVARQGQLMYSEI